MNEAHTTTINPGATTADLNNIGEAGAGAQAPALLQPQRPQREFTQVIDAVPMLDTAKFEHMMRIAKVMASSMLVPDHLLMRKVGEGQNARYEHLDMEQKIANCFLVVNQAVRWNMDPFAVAQNTFVHKGKLGYEGKLIAAAIQSHPKFEGRLNYVYDGKTGDQRRVRVIGTVKGAPLPLEIEGTVDQWKTANDMWRRQVDQSLAYRGAREWARRHLPEAILGVMSDDEVKDIGDRDEQPPPAPRAPAKSASGALDAFAGTGSTTVDGEARREPTEPTQAAPEKVSTGNIATNRVVRDGKQVDTATGLVTEMSDEDKASLRASLAAHQAAAQARDATEYQFPEPEEALKSAWAKKRWAGMWRWFCENVMSVPPTHRQEFVDLHTDMLLTVAGNNSGYRKAVMETINKAGATLNDGTARSSDQAAEETSAKASSGTTGASQTQGEAGAGQ